MEMNHSKIVGVDDMFEHQGPYYYKYHCGYYIIVDTMSYLRQLGLYGGSYLYYNNICHM